MRAYVRVCVGGGVKRVRRHFLVSICPLIFKQQAGGVLVTDKEAGLSSHSLTSTHSALLSGRHLESRKQLRARREGPLRRGRAGAGAGVALWLCALGCAMLVPAPVLFFFFSLSLFSFSSGWIFLTPVQTVPHPLTTPTPHTHTPTHTHTHAARLSSGS